MPDPLIPRSPRVRRPSLHPIVAYLRSVRLAHGIAPSILARRIGVSRELLSRWECGVCHPRLTHLYAWANALELDLLPCPLTKPSTNQPSLNEASPILHSYRALRSNMPSIPRR